MGKRSRSHDSSSSTNHKASNSLNNFDTICSSDSSESTKRHFKKSSHRDKKLKRAKRDKEEKSKRKRDTKKNKTRKKSRVKQISWGKYGQVQEKDLWKKRQEFQLWLLEIKDRNLETLPNWEEKLLFKEYMEDYNTATFPHKKYYDLDKWERKMAKKNEPIPRNFQGTTFNDEKLRMQEIQKLRDQRAAENLKAEYTVMKEDSDKVAAIKNQKLLQQRMEQLFKFGRISEAQKIQALLKPDAI